MKNRKRKTKTWLSCLENFNKPTKFTLKRDLRSVYVVLIHTLP